MPANRCDVRLFEQLLDLTETRVKVEQMALRMAVAHGDVERESQGPQQLPSPVPRRGSNLDRGEAGRLGRGASPLPRSPGGGARIAWTLRLCRLLYDQSERYRNLSMQPARKRKRDVGTEHRELMEAALARDADALCKLVEAHFRQTTDLILGSGLADRSSRNGRRSGRIGAPG